MGNRKVIYLDDAINALERKKDKKSKGDIGGFYNTIIQNDIDALMQLPSAQPEYTELAPEEAASEIASGSTMSAYYWLDDMMRLKQMGYVICRKNDERCIISRQAVVMCKDCIHRPTINDQRDIGGVGLRFPDDSKCPCRCDDPYYSWMPNDNWFCGNGEKE